MTAPMPLRVLIVDDEPLARARLRSLLADIAQPAVEVCGEAGTAAQALEMRASTQPHVVLLDIHMPGMDGMELARRLYNTPAGCQIIFVTASSEHALQAFDLAAADYLTKPVRRERLQQALFKALAQAAMQQTSGALLAAPPFSAALAQPPTGPCLLIQDRGQTQRLALADILYARAELKYVTLCTRTGREIVWDGSLNQLEEQHPQHFLRIHRNAVVQRNALRQIKRFAQRDGGDAWMLQLEGSPEWLNVSRRQLPLVRQALQNF